MTKYSVPDDHWDDSDDSTAEFSPVHVDSHTVDVIHTTDPNESMGYGRDRYSAHVTHGDDGPTVLYFTKHRWKGNYWREHLELDWRDTPGVVRRQVADVVACDGVDDLDPGHRLIDEGGEACWASPNDEEVRDGDD